MVGTKVSEAAVGKNPWIEQSKYTKHQIRHWAKELEGTVANYVLKMLPKMPQMSHNRIRQIYPISCVGKKVFSGCS